MECKQRQRLAEEYFDALKRQKWISARLQAVRATGDPQLISVGEKQEDEAIEESYEAWEALNKHQCSGRCE